MKVEKVLTSLAKHVYVVHLSHVLLCVFKYSKCIIYKCTVSQSIVWGLSYVLHNYSVLLHLTVDFYTVDNFTSHGIYSNWSCYIDFTNKHCSDWTCDICLHSSWIENMLLSLWLNILLCINYLFKRILKQNVVRTYKHIMYEWLLQQHHITLPAE